MRALGRIALGWGFIKEHGRLRIGKRITKRIKTIGTVQVCTDAEKSSHPPCRRLLVGKKTSGGKKSPRRRFVCADDKLSPRDELVMVSYKSVTRTSLVNVVMLYGLLGGVVGVWTLKARFGIFREAFLAEVWLPDQGWETVVGVEM